MLSAPLIPLDVILCLTVFSVIRHDISLLTVIFCIGFFRVEFILNQNCSISYISMIYKKKKKFESTVLYYVFSVFFLIIFFQRCILDGTNNPRITPAGRVGAENINKDVAVVTRQIHDIFKGGA